MDKDNIALGIIIAIGLLAIGIYAGYYYGLDIGVKKNAVASSLSDKEIADNIEFLLFEYSGAYDFWRYISIYDLAMTYKFHNMDIFTNNPKYARASLEIISHNICNSHIGKGFILEQMSINETNITYENFLKCIVENRVHPEPIPNKYSFKEK